MVMLIRLLSFCCSYEACGFADMRMLAPKVLSCMFLCCSGLTLMWYHMCVGQWEHAKPWPYTYLAIATFSYVLCGRLLWLSRVNFDAHSVVVLVVVPMINPVAHLATERLYGCCGCVLWFTFDFVDHLFVVVYGPMITVAVNMYWGYLRGCLPLML